MLAGWLSGTGTDIDRPILSASPWYLASLSRSVLSGTGSSGLLLYLACRMARGVAGNPGATPDREDPEPELLLSPCESLFEGVLCRSCGR